MLKMRHLLLFTVTKIYIKTIGCKFLAIFFTV